MRLASADLPDLVRLHLDAEVSRFLGGTRTPEVTAAYLDTNLRQWADHGVGLWTLRAEDGTFLGRAGLRHVALEGVQELEIAYTFVRSAWGRGLATEIAQALVGIWEAHRPEPSLVGIAMKSHTASEHVLGKTGFADERDTIFQNEECGVFRRSRSKCRYQGGCPWRGGRGVIFP